MKEQKMGVVRNGRLPVFSAQLSQKSFAMKKAEKEILPGFTVMIYSIFQR